MLHPPFPPLLLPLQPPLCSPPWTLGRAPSPSFFDPPGPAASSLARARGSASTPKLPAPGRPSGRPAPTASRLHPPSGDWLCDPRLCIQPALNTHSPGRGSALPTRSLQAPTRPPPALRPISPHPRLASLAWPPGRLDASLSLTSAPAANAQLRRASLPVTVAGAPPLLPPAAPDEPNGEAPPEPQPLAHSSRRQADAAGARPLHQVSGGAVERGRGLPGAQR